MLCKTANYISKNRLFTKTDKILVAVSGGIDSVVLLHVLTALGYDCSVAHCHFHLRGSESDRDFTFVQNLAKKYNLPFFSTHFDTEKVADERKISVEMAARDLRYAWFAELAKEQNFACVAVAHHANDSAETFFINLARGTGIHGLTGIKLKQNLVVRPLLFAQRTEIEAFAKEVGLDFVYDSTNDDTVFRRNLVRHEILPELEKLNPAFLQNLQKTIGYLSDIEAISDNYCKTVRQNILHENNGIFQIDIEKVLKSVAPKTVLYELLLPFGFNSEIAEQIFDNLNGNSGKIFISKTHRLVKDRDFLLIESLKSVESERVAIDVSTNEIFSPLHLIFSRESKEIVKNVGEAFLDFDKLEFPLELRLWQKGDRFTPYGMRNQKKISDLLIDEKLSLLEKSRTWVLTSRGKIVWVVGLRIDENYKITSETNHFYHIKLVK